MGSEYLPSTQAQEKRIQLVDEDLSAKPGDDDMPTPDFTIHDAETGASLTTRLCHACRGLNLGRMIKSAAGTHETNDHKTPRLKSVKVKLGLGCPLCDFLGFPPTQRPGDIAMEYSKDPGHFQNVASNRPAIDLDLACYEKHEKTGHMFHPCVFDITRNQGQSLLYDRKVLPVIHDKVAVIPETSFGPLRPPSVNFDPFRGWIRRCERDHKRKCSARSDDGSDEQSSLLQGFRVMDCTQGLVVPFTLDQPYVALSYVWGQPNPQEADPSTTSTDPSSASTTHAEFPDTVKDAITVTLKLGFCYLWVDKYCIDQTNSIEKQQQISAMDRIYQSAALTIIAAAGENATYGLPGVRPNSRESQPRLIINGTLFVSAPWQPENDVRESTWNTRAWTLQEGYFARRRLIFSHEQAIFECNEMVALEIPHPGDKVNDAKGLRDYFEFCHHFFRRPMSVISNPQRVWQILSVIQACSARHLSFQSDGINVVQGILSSQTAKECSDLANDFQSWRFVHFWGVPVTLGPYKKFFYPYMVPRAKEVAALSTEKQYYAALTFGLAWFGTSTKPVLVRRDGFPSWSWAGWKGEVQWSYYRLRVQCFETELPSHVWVHTADGEMKELNHDFISIVIQAGGFHHALNTQQLVIETTILELMLSYEPLWKRYVVRSPLDNSDIRSDVGTPISTRDAGKGELVWPIAITPAVKQSDQLHDELCNDSFQCAVMYGHFGLLLRTRDGVSERLGVVESLDATYRSLPTFSGTISAPGLEEEVSGASQLPHRVRCLANYFPSRTARILLE